MEVAFSSHPKLSCLSCEASPYHHLGNFLQSPHSGLEAKSPVLREFPSHYAVTYEWWMGSISEKINRSYFWPMGLQWPNQILLQHDIPSNSMCLPMAFPLQAKHLNFFKYSSWHGIYNPSSLSLVSLWFGNTILKDIFFSQTKKSDLLKMFSIKSYLVIVENRNLTSADKTKECRSWQDQTIPVRESMSKPGTKPKTKTTKPHWIKITLNMEFQQMFS